MKKLFILITAILFTAYNSYAGYNQIGQWSKEDATKLYRTTNNSWLKSKIESIAKFLGATAFYLGKYNGSYLVATNRHVCYRYSVCYRYPLRFKYLDRDIKIEDYIYSSSEIDFAIISLKINNKNKQFIQKLKTLKQSFDWKSNFEVGEELFTLGHGYYNNPDGNLKYEYAGQCQIASSDIKKITDPDKGNPSQVKVWSAAIGCDSSSNDSGSPVYSLRTKKLLGILWTARTPSLEALHDERIFYQMIEEDSSLIWDSLTYFVPAKSIREVIIKDIESGTFIRDEAKAILEDFLDYQFKK
ncbi:MAG: serine protease [Bacteriovoracaceae bacterium]|jgi:hypothetical protein|nr:serine protease [Bacteriovoracaceae bacterium]